MWRSRHDETEAGSCDAKGRDGFPVGYLVAVRMVHLGSHWFPCTIISRPLF